MRREMDEMAAQQLPEMLRCPLESVCLRIKTLKLGFIREFLAKVCERDARGKDARGKDRLIYCCSAGTLGD
jgi:HrpA-like RNA helicase